MTVSVVLSIAGVVALLLGVWGGGIKAKEIEIPRTSPRVRTIVSIVGLVLISTSIWLSAPDSAPQLRSYGSPVPSGLVSLKCKDNNLINCSKPIPIFVPAKSSSVATFNPDGLVIDFNNNPLNASGLAFKFASPLDVKGFNFLEISGTSTQDFAFLIEYKVIVGRQLKIVTSSTNQLFSASSTTLSIKIPITYGGSIDEIAINFFEKGQFSTFVVEAIYLKQ